MHTMVKRAYYVFKFKNTLYAVVLHSFLVFLVQPKTRFTANGHLFIWNLLPDVWLYSDEAFAK